MRSELPPEPWLSFFDERLAAAGHLHPQVLKERYEKELRGYLARPEREDLTLKLWIESYWPGKLR